MSIQEYLDTFVILTQEEIDKLNLEERTYYRENLKNYRDLRNVISTAKKEGQQKRIEKGKEIKTIDVTKKMLLMNSTFEFIAEITDLSIEEIQKIADSLKE